MKPDKRGHVVNLVSRTSYPLRGEGGRLGIQPRNRDQNKNTEQDPADKVPRKLFFEFPWDRDFDRVKAANVILIGFDLKAATPRASDQANTQGRHEPLKIFNERACHGTDSEARN